MKVKEMIAVLSKYDGEMRVGLLDLSTDNYVDMNYLLSEDVFEVMDLVSGEESHEIIGQGLFITFDNHLNENPITVEESSVEKPFIPFAEIHDTEHGPVLMYKLDLFDQDKPHHLVTIAAGKGDHVVVTTKYETTGSRDYDFAFPASTIKSVLNQYKKCHQSVGSDTKNK